MSVHQFVFVSPRQIPTTEAWQASLNLLDVGVVLDDAASTASHNGYWPALMNGTTTGFEYFIGDVSTVVTVPPPAEVGAERTIAVDFCTHSDLIELRCAMLAAAAFCTAADGVYLDDSTAEIMSASDVIAAALAI